MIIGIFALSTTPIYVMGQVSNDSSDTSAWKSNDTVLLEKSIAKLLDKHDAFRGEILISSSTIFAFVGFGSFLTLRFENGDKDYLLGNIRYILFCFAYIGISQIYIIVSVGTDQFNSTLYEILMSGIGPAFGLILFFIYGVITEQSRGRVVQPIALKLDEIFRKSFTL